MFHSSPATSEAGSSKPECNRNEPPKRLPVPIASLDHDLNSDELLFAVGEFVYINNIM